MIIGVSGKIGNGKDTVGKIIQYLTTNKSDISYSGSYNSYLIDVAHGGKITSPWRIKKFAGKLKQITSILTGIPVEDLEKQDVKDSILDIEWQKLIRTPTDENTRYTESTVRWLLQVIGTEAMREVIHPNVWVNALFADYKGVSAPNGLPGGYIKFPNWIITDVRFPNEAEAIIKHGGVVLRVNRGKVPPCVGHSQHPSETALDNYDGFYAKIDNNGSLEELTHKIKEVLQKLNLIN